MFGWIIVGYGIPSIFIWCIGDPAGEGVSPPDAGSQRCWQYYGAKVNGEMVPILSSLQYFFLKCTGKSLLSLYLRRLCRNSKEIW